MLESTEHITGGHATTPVNTRLNQLPADSGGSGGGQPDLASSPAEKRAAAKAIEDHIEPGTKTSADWADEETNAAVKELKAAYHMVGGAVTPLYVTTGPVSIAYGDALQRGVDTLTWELGNSMKADADATANAAIADEYLRSNEKVAYMIDGWAQGRSDIDTSTPEGQDLVRKFTTNMLQGHNRGAETAGKYMTDTAN
ncbi:hypothetical protein [Streptomyces sp. YIM S03343]